jgi:integrase
MSGAKVAKAGPVDTVKSGPVTIGIYKEVEPGKVLYAARWTEGGIRRRFRRKDLKTAKEDARKTARRLASGAPTLELEKLTPAQVALCAEVIRRGITMTDLDRVAGLPEQIAVDKAIDLFLAAKAKQKARSDRHIRTLRGTLGKLKDFLKKRRRKTIQSVTKHDFNHWIESAPSPRTGVNWRNNAVNCWRWCKAQEHLPHDRPTAVEASDRPRVEGKEPDILTPEQFATFLQVCPVEYLPYVVIGGFCGLRTSEMVQGRNREKRVLQWEDVMLDDKEPYIRVPFETAAKEDRRRIVYLNPAPVKWLKLLHKGTGQILPNKAPDTRYHAEVTVNEMLRDSIGEPEWKNNWLRHSFASYRTVELGKEYAFVAGEMGNSEQVIRKHYEKAVTRLAAKEFWSLTPSKVGRKLGVAA